MMILSHSSWLLSSGLFTIISVIAEDSHDIWHHDLGVAIINNQKSPSKADQELQTQMTTRPPDRTFNTSRKVPIKERQDEVPDSSSQVEGCDFGGRKLRVAVSPQPPLVNCIQNLYGDWLCNGSNIEVIGVLEKKLNFQAEWIVLTSSNHLDRTSTATRQSGKVLTTLAGVIQTKLPPDNSINYTGIMGMVGSGRAWLSANGLMTTPDRQRDLLLSEPFDSFRLHFLLSKTVRDHDHIFVKPFSSLAWLAILVSACLMVPIFYLINSTSSHYAMLDDKFLARISFLSCLRYLLSRAKAKSQCLCTRPQRPAIRRNSASSSSSSSSTSSSFDDKLDKMVTAPDSKVWPEQELERQRHQRRRALRRRWALERRRARRSGRAARKSGFFKVAYIVWYVVGSLAYQGGETEDLPYASSTRILVAFWWLYLIVISSIHSGILTAILTFPKQNDFIQNLDDFLAIGEAGGKPLKLLVDKHSELANLLSNEDNLHKSPMQLLMRPLTSDRDGRSSGGYPIVHVDFQRHRQRILDEVQRGQSAYLEEKSTINLIITQEYFDQRPAKCHFKSSRYPIDIVPMSLVLSRQLSSTCIATINGLMRKIMRTGLAQKWRRNYEAQGNDCLNTVVINAGDVDKIELKHVNLAFWLLLIGLLCGALFLIIEVVWLFTAEVDDTSSSGSSSTSTSGSSSSDNEDGEHGTASSFQELKLGHKAAMLALANGDMQGPPKLRSLARRPFKRPPSAFPVPDLTSVKFDNGVLSTIELMGRDAGESITTKGKGSATSSAVSKNNNNSSRDTIRLDKKRKRTERAAQRRARRLRRTLELVRRLQEGKIYSDFFLKVSGNVQNRARRASQAIVSRIAVNVPTARVRKHSSGSHMSNTNQSLGGRQSSLTSDGPPIRRRRIKLANGQVAPSG